MLNNSVTKFHAWYQDTTSNSTEVISSSAAVDTTTSDTRGIPGWDKVGHLAKLLTELTGIAVSTHQAGQLKALYDALDDYDKHNIKVHLKTLPQLRGRFCRKKRPGKTHEELMSRYIYACHCNDIIINFVFMHMTQVPSFWQSFPPWSKRKLDC